MKKRYLFCSFLILLISYVAYNFNKNFLSPLPTEQIGIENKKCKNIKSDYTYEDLIKLNENILIAPTYNSYFYDYLYGKKLTNGKIFALNLKNEEFFEVPLKNFPKNITFEPLAVDILNQKYLFVINHRKSYDFSNEQIEVFKISLTGKKGIELEYFKSIILPNNFLLTLNAIGVKDLDTFYFTTWQVFGAPNTPKEINSFLGKIWFKFKQKFLMISLFLNLKFTNVYIYHKGTIKKIENSDAIFNNGLTLDKDNNLLYAVRSIEKDIKVYKISEKGDDAKLVKTMPIPYITDNIYYHNGKLNLGINHYMMSNKNIKDEIMKGNDAKNITHFSGFMEINTQNDKITDILLQDAFKGVSSGIKINNKIIMTSIAFKGIYICQNN